MKERIYLDGLPGQGGTVRASYQPAGLFNDNDNNVVHVKLAADMSLWFPWALAAFSLGAVAYATRRWRREKSRQP